MSSLARCLKKLGISGHHATILRGQLAEFDARTSTEAALKEVLRELHDERQSIVGQLTDKGFAAPSMDAALSARLLKEIESKARPALPPPPEQTQVDAAAAQAEGHEASKAQQDAGNYQKGHIQIGPEGAKLDISIENEAGTSRRPEWPPLKDHYGYVKGSIGHDKDHLDVFIVPGTPADYSGTVWVVNQMVTRSDNFDEHKAIIGVEYAAKALDIARSRGMIFMEQPAAFVYKRNYEPGWDDYQDPIPMTWGGFRRWALDQGNDGPGGGPLSLETAKMYDALARAAHGAPQHLSLINVPLPNGESAAAFANTQVELEAQRNITLPTGRIRNATDAAVAFRQLNRWPRERFQMLGVDAKGRPIAFYDLFSGTLAEANVYGREVWTALYQTPGVRGVWIAHNHPSGTATFSRSDELLTQMLRQLLTPQVGIQYLGHILVAGNDALEMETGERIKLHQLPRSETTSSIPVLERVVSRQETPRASLTSPAASREFLRRLKPERPGIVIMDAQHRAVGWWDMSLEKMQQSGPAPFGRAAADVLRLIGRNNPGAAILYAPPGTGTEQQLQTAARNMTDLFMLTHVKLLDAFLGLKPVGSEPATLVSLAERGLMAATGRYNDTTMREPAPTQEMERVENGPASDTIYGWRRFAEEQAKVHPEEKAWPRLTEWLATQDRLFGTDRQARLTKQRILTVLWGSSFSLRRGTAMGEDHGELPSHEEGLLRRYEELERRVDAAYEAGDPKAEELDAELAQLRDVVTGIGEEFSALDEADHEAEPEVDRGLVQQYARWLKAETAEDRAYAIEAARDLLIQGGATFARVGSTSDADMLEAMHDAFASRAERLARVKASYSLDVRGNGLGVTPERVMADLLGNKLAQEMGNRVRIARDARDLPSHLYEKALRMGATKLVRGAWDPDTGLVYVVSSNIQQGEAERVLLHEAVGHAGVSDVLGKELYDVLQDIYRSRQGEIQAEARNGFLQPYQFDFTRPHHQAEAASEWIAHKAENGEETTLWAKFVAAVRQILRSLGFVRTWSDADILNLLQLSRSRLMHEGGETFNGRPLFQLGEVGPLWYSALARQIENLKMESASAEQWDATIDQLPGVKRDEIRWSGIMEFLHTHDDLGAPIGKAWILKYLRENGVTLEETLYGRLVDDPDMKAWDDATVRLHALGYQVITDAGHLQALQREDQQVYQLVPTEELQAPLEEQLAINAPIRQFEDLPAEERELVQKLRAGEHAFRARHRLRSQGATRYSSWQLPGGRDYRELLITVPHMPAFQGKHGYMSGHWDPTNIVAHVRFNERTDSEGKRVLFIEEIQSDWAEQGRKQKFDVVPHGPFVEKTEQWVSLALKRMVRWASDNGFDRVAWTTGDQQNRRYGLEREISLVTYFKNRSGSPYGPAGTYNLHLRSRSSPWRPIQLSGLDEERVRKILGDKIAADIFRDQGELLDDRWYDKKVYEFAGVLGFEPFLYGGDPMRAYYDKMLPNIANDVLKKLGGGRVGTTRIGLDTTMPTPAQARYEQPGFDITEAMRLSAARGMPMFALRADPPGVREVYGVREGRVLGMATRGPGGVWNVYLANGTNETLFERGEFRRDQAGNLNGVARAFAREGLELRIVKPRNIPVPDRSLFDQNWVAPQADTWLRRSIIYFQNRLLLPRLYEETIEREVGPIPESAKAHREARLAHPRAAGKIADFEHEYIEPVVELMRKYKLSLKDVGLYLYARHAPERNAAIEAINPDNTTGSGMSNERAAQVLEAFEAFGKLEQLREVEAVVRSMIAAREQVMIDKGLVSRQAVELLRQKYDHYVPLKELPQDEFANEELGGGYRVGRSFRSAFGRFTEAQAEYILPGVVAQAKGTIAAGENAEVLRAFLHQVEFAPNPDVWKIEKHIWTPYIDRDTGQLQYAPRPAQMVDRTHVISIPVNGERVLVRVGDEDLAKAFNSSGLPLSDALKLIGVVTRFYAMMATAANPEFIAVNAMRDFQQAMILLTGRENVALATKVAKDMMPALWGAFSGLRAEGQYVPEHSALPLAENWHAWYRRYIEAGGHIAYRGMQDVETQHKDFLVKLAEAGVYPENAGELLGSHRLAQIRLRLHRLTSRGALGALGGTDIMSAKWFSQLVIDLNGAVENALRLSTFKNAVQDGMSEKDAAFLARNVTVDFNLKGEAGTRIGALYMFFNANIQGPALLLRSIINHPKVRAAALTIFLLGMLMDWWNRHWAEPTKDGRNFYDNIGSDVKERNLVIMGPDRKGAVTIPLPFGFNVFYIAGQNVMATLPRTAGGAGKSPLKAAGETFVATVNAYSPFGNSPTSWLGALQLISPTITDAPVQAMTNRNFADKSIVPERPKGAPPQAKASTYFAGTSDLYVDAAQKMNELTGGNEVRSGAIDISPNMLRHWVQSVFGSAGAFFARVAEAVGQKAQGKPTETRNIPFLRRFYYEPQDYELSRRFYENVNAAEVAHYEVLRQQQRGHGDTAAMLRQEFQGERSMFGEAQSAEHTVAKMRQQIALVRKQRNLTDEQKKVITDKLEAQARDIMMGFNLSFENKVEGK